MIILPSMIAKAAIDAGMKVPEDPNGEWEILDFFHFHVFCTVQLCRTMRWGDHWENAKIIADFTQPQLESMSLNDLISVGLDYHHSNEFLEYKENISS